MEVALEADLTGMTVEVDVCFNPPYRGSSIGSARGRGGASLFIHVSIHLIVEVALEAQYRPTWRHLNSLVSIHLIVEVALEADGELDVLAGRYTFQSTLSWK